MDYILIGFNCTMIGKKYPLPTVPKISKSSRTLFPSLAIAKVQQEFYLYKCTFVSYYIKLIHNSI